MVYSTYKYKLNTKFDKYILVVLMTKIGYLFSKNDPNIIYNKKSLILL